MALLGLYPVAQVIWVLSIVVGGNEVLPALCELQKLFGLFAFQCFIFHHTYIGQDVTQRDPSAALLGSMQLSFPGLCLANSSHPGCPELLIFSSARTPVTVWVPSPLAAAEKQPPYSKLGESSGNHPFSQGSQSLSNDWKLFLVFCLVVHYSGGDSYSNSSFVSGSRNHPPLNVNSCRIKMEMNG